MSVPTYDVLLFASLRERAKTDVITLEAAGIETVRDLLAAVAKRAPAIAEMVEGCRVAVDQEFVGPDAALRPGVEIAIIPPVSGGHDGPSPEGEPRVALLETPLSLDTVVRAVTHPGAGGISTFTGNVRLQSRGLTIEHLDYEAYAPMALKVMMRIVDTIQADIEGSRVAIAHRIGRLVVGETAVVIAASAPHRAEAFAACRAAIEALKEDVPIWKKEVATDGESWIGRGP